MIDIMRTHTVPLYRRKQSKGFLDENNEWQQGSFFITLTLDCNIQPLREGKHKVILPDGVRTDDVLILRSYEQLIVADDFEDLEGDEIEFKGRRYEIFKEEDWSSYGLPTDHYKYLFKRQDRR